MGWRAMATGAAAIAQTLGHDDEGAAHAIEPLPGMHSRFSHEE